MSLTTIDPASALIVIDLQRGITGRGDLAPYSAGEVVARCRGLVDGFRAAGSPVVFVTVSGVPAGRTDVQPGGGSTSGFPAGWDELIDEFYPAPDDLRVVKYSRSAFANTDLADALRERGITQVVVTGIATASGVESTARDAHEAGFHVTVPTDAITDSDPDAHAHSVSKVFPKIAETGSTAELLELIGVTRR